MNILIVGSGCTGLSAAILLAKQGHCVHVIEKGNRSAPLLRGFSRDGLYFDTGFHFGGDLHPSGVLRRWFRVLGVDESLPSIPLNPDDANLFLYADGHRLAMPYGREALLAMVSTHFPEHVTAMMNLLDDFESVLSQSPYTNPEKLSSEPSMDMDVSPLLDHLAHFPPELQMVLRTFCLLYGVHPQKALWKDYAMITGTYLRSSHALKGGGKAIADALEQEARRHGVLFTFNAAVTTFSVQEDASARHGIRLSGVELDTGEKFACDSCIYTGHPSHLGEMIPAGIFRPAYLRHLSELPETTRPLLLFGSTRSDFLDGRNVFLLGSEGSNNTVHDTMERTIFLAATYSDTKGRRPVTAITTAPPFAHVTEADYKKAKTEAVEHLAKTIRNACPELADMVVLDTATDLSFQHWIHGARGGIYGVRHDRDTTPLLPMSHLSGFFLAGQHILLPGILGCIISAAVAVGCIVGHQTVFKELRACNESV